MMQRGSEGIPLILASLFNQYPQYLILTLLPIVVISLVISQQPCAANGDDTYKLKLHPTAAKESDGEFENITWEDWRPAQKTVLTISAYIIAGSEETDAITSTSYTFTLRNNVSDYPGFCMNKGDQSDSQKDIYFRQTDQPADTDQLKYRVSGTNGPILTVTCKTPHTGISIYLYVDDYGGHGILDGFVSLNDKEDAEGEEEDGTPSNNTSANDSLSIPKDNNGNDIADGWQDDAIHDYDPWADEETGPGNNTFRGDGFTVLEEYRGFIVQGEHIRTDSRKKDLFIHSEFDEGIGYASNLPDDIITTHQILFAEMNDPIKKDAQGNDVMDAQGNPVIDVQGDPCVMNSRSCGNALQVVKQRDLWVRKHENANGSYTHSNGTDYVGIYGIIEPVVGPCHQVLYVYIFHEYIKERNKAAVAEMEEHEPNKALPTTSEMIKRYIGHELGHGINLYHPWLTDRVGGALGTFLFNRPGETIMDYGDPHVVGEYSNKGYNAAASSYMSGYEGSKEYPDFHNSEYQFVAPDVRAAHLAKPLLDPPRKTKPQWELDNDEDNDNGTGTDGQAQTPRHQIHRQILVRLMGMVKSVFPGLLAVVRLPVTNTGIAWMCHFQYGVFGYPRGRTHFLMFWG